MVKWEFTEPQHYISDVVAMVLVGEARRATKYVSPTLTIKATAQRKFRSGCRQSTVLLTYGKPNYAERTFIAACKKAGESFPVRKVQVQKWKS